MAQSFKRQLKRGNLVAIWNPTLRQYDFFRRAKNTGRYLLTHAFNRNGGTGPGLHIKSIIKLQREVANR